MTSTEAAVEGVPFVDPPWYDALKKTACYWPCAVCAAIAIAGLTMRPWAILAVLVFLLDSLLGVMAYGGLLDDLGLWTRRRLVGAMTCLNVIMVLWALVAVVSPMPERRLDTFPSDCFEGRGFCVRLTDDASSTLPRKDVPVFKRSCNKVWESVLCHAEREGDERVFDNRLGKNGRVARFVYSTPFMGYMDDVFVAAFCSEDDQGDEQSELWFHSQSRVGSGDFGANYARVKSIIEAVDEGWSGCSWAELRA